MNFEIDDKYIEIFYKNNGNKTLPVVILNTYGREGAKVWEECQALMVSDFILVAISNIDWNNEMTPWECEPLYKNDRGYGGNADKYLKLLEDKIIPKVTDVIENEINVKIQYFAIAGYSLGGLFAVYSAFKTDLFKRVISVSGSMWYPNFAEYVKQNEISKNVDKIYFSLGNKEKKAKIEILQTVDNKTKEIKEYLEKSVQAIYEENPGNHFQEPEKRVAKGLKWGIS